MRAIELFKRSGIYGSEADSLGKEVAILEQRCQNAYPGLAGQLRAEKYDNPHTARLAEACADELDGVNGSATAPAVAKPPRRGKRR